MCGEYVVVTVTGTGFTQIIPERPSPTQEWDTSLL
jgi:hypothetical protein